MNIATLAACLMVAGCASSPDLDVSRRGSDPQDPPHSAVANTSSDAAAAPTVAVVRELEIAEFAEDNVECRREAPLGSRISVRRCYSTADGPESPAEAALAEIARQELEQMRQQQMWREQQRIARDMALRQGAINAPQR